MELDDIREIKPPVYFPQDLSFLIVVGIIAVLTGLIYLFIYFKKRRKKQPSKPTPTLKLADQIALEALTELQAKNLPGQGKIKQFYYEFSDIVRYYIENRFSIKAPEMTTEEFLFSLRDSFILSNSHKNLLKDFLTLCDIVKFARYGPTHKEVEESLASAKRLINETRSVAQKPQEALIK